MYVVYQNLKMYVSKLVHITWLTLCWLTVDSECNFTDSLCCQQVIRDG